MHNSNYFDPEDLIHDIMQSMMAPSHNQNRTNTIRPEEEDGSENAVRSADGMTGAQGHPHSAAGAIDSNNVSQHMVMQEAMNLEEIICRSICAVDNSETRKRLAS